MKKVIAIVGIAGLLLLTGCSRTVDRYDDTVNCRIVE